MEFKLYVNLFSGCDKLKFVCTAIRDILPVDFLCYFLSRGKKYPLTCRIFLVIIPTAVVRVDAVT